jgi:hypothetical protein
MLTLFTFIIRDLLTSNPPVDLTETYQDCKSKACIIIPLTSNNSKFCIYIQWYDAAFDSLGIASGNAATMVPLVMLACLPLLYLYLQVSILTLSLIGIIFFVVTGIWSYPSKGRVYK